MNRPVRRRSRGWTLIEALLAVSLTAVLAAVIMSTSLTVHRVFRDRARRMAQGALARETVARLAADLERACEPPKGPAMRLETHPSGPVRMDLLFYTFLPPPDASDPRWAAMRETRVQAMEEDAGGSMRLRRIERPVAGPGAGSGGLTSEVPGRVGSLSVELCDGDAWHDAWPVREDAALPSAARIRLVVDGMAGPATARVDTVIRAGAPVKPGFERRSATPAAR